MTREKENEIRSKLRLRERSTTNTKNISCSYSSGWLFCNFPCLNIFWQEWNMNTKIYSVRLRVLTHKPPKPNQSKNPESLGLSLIKTLCSPKLLTLKLSFAKRSNLMWNIQPALLKDVISDGGKHIHTAHSKYCKHFSTIFTFLNLFLQSLQINSKNHKFDLAEIGTFYPFFSS